MSEINLEDLLAAQRVTTQDPQLVVKMPNNKLPVGRHQFDLKVEDDSGNQSNPARISVIVMDTSAPTAVIELFNAQGQPITDGRISFGAEFILSGKRSVDVGGTISKYVWEVVPQ